MDIFDILTMTGGLCLFLFGMTVMGDALERIGDHAKNILEAAEELHTKKLQFSDDATLEITVLIHAVQEIIETALQAFSSNDLETAYRVEPLEQVIDDLKETLRFRHILRLQQGSCSIETGFVWSDLLTALERIGDHCSNIAGCIIDHNHHNRNTHETLRSMKTGSQDFVRQYADYAKKYTV